MEFEDKEETKDNEEAKDNEEIKEENTIETKPSEENQTQKEPSSDKLSEMKTNLTEKMRENPWILSTIVFGVLVLILFSTTFLGDESITGNVISEEEAGKTIVDLASSQLGAEVELVNVESENGLYEVTFSSEGKESSVYITLDGENLVNGLIPLDVVMQQDQQEPEDWNIFENEVPSDMKSKILSFVIEEPEEYDSSMGINEFKNYELIPKTLIVFYSSGCGWCSRYYLVLVEAMEKYPEITIYALVLSDDGDIAEKYGVTGTPANIINGKYFVSGYRSLEDLSEVLDELN